MAVVIDWFSGSIGNVGAGMVATILLSGSSAGSFQ